MSSIAPAVHRAIVCVDVQGFGDRRRINPHQVSVRSGLHSALSQAFTQSGVRWESCYHEDRGDGALILVPPEVPKEFLVVQLPHQLVAALTTHNREHGPQGRIRLRLALHAGEVHFDEHGVAGSAINMTFRLLSAEALKRALASSSGFLAVIASPWFYEEVIRPAHRMEFGHRVRAGDYDIAAFVLDECGEFLVVQGSHREVIRMHMMLDGKLVHDTAKLAHLVGYGQARWFGGPLEEAVPPLNVAVELAERIGDRRQLQRALFALGDSCRQLRRLDEASKLLARAADIARETNEPRHEAHALVNLSIAYCHLGNLTAAFKVCDQLCELSSRSADAVIHGRVGDALSAAYVVAERWQDAIEAAQQSITSYTAADWPEAVGLVRAVQGIALLGLHRIEDAIEVFTCGNSDGLGIEYARAQGLSMFNLAWAHWISGQYGDAQQAADRAVTAFRQSGRADTSASEALLRAVDKMLAGDPKTAAADLRKAALLVHGNTDLIPERWLVAEADRLDSVTQKP